MPQYSQGPTPGEIFADGIDRITIHSAVVRIDFFSFETQAQDARSDREPDRTVRQRVVMPLDGFLRSFAAMSDIVKKLENSGVVTRNPPAGQPASTVATGPGPVAATGAAPAAPAAGGKKSTSSPNFG